MEFTTMPITSTPALTPNNNMTSEEIEQYLDHLQDEEIKQFIPALVFLLLLAVTGLVGNVLVLLVYRFKYPKSPTRIFIMSISLFDLTTNVLCTAGHVYKILHLWDFTWSWLCGFIDYTIAATTITSAGILVAVAVSRYKKVCKPFGKQVTVKQAKIATFSVAVFSWIVAIPFFIIHGRHNRPTPISEIDGDECYTADEYIKTIWPVINYGFALLLFLSLCTAMVILYTLIGIKAYKHSKIHGGKPAQRNENFSSKELSKTNTSHLTENKPSSKSFGFLNTKNTSKDRHAANAFEKKERSMTEENRLIEKNEDCSKVTELSQFYVKGIVDLTTSSDLTPDSLRLEETDYDGEIKTGSYVTSCDENDMNHETMVDVHIETGDNKKSEDVNNESHGTFPDFEGTLNQNTLSTDIEAHGNSAAQSGIDSRLECVCMASCFKDDNGEALTYALTRWETLQNDGQNKKERNDDETVDITSIEGEKILIHCQNELSDRPPISAFEAKDVTNKSVKHTAKTVNECILVPTIKGDDMSNETTLDLEKTNKVLHACGKNSQKSFFNKTTGILLLVTALYIVCFIPHFATVFFRYTSPSNYKALGASSLTAYHFFYRFFMINSAANPFLYSLRDANFRRNVLRLFKSR